MTPFKARSSRLRAGVFLALALALPACDSATEAGLEGRQLGLIAGYNQGDPVIVIPDSVWAGAAFSVGVTTYGDSCVRKGETEVTSSRSRATITPYDYVEPPGAVCLSFLQSFSHEATVEFPEAGAATLRVVGRAGGALDEELVIVTREVLVRARPSSN